MSINIQKLHIDEREVGKTLKGTKKYYLWQFVLNDKFHKVEIFHSKVSGKKKLCLDAQMLCEDKGYTSSFTYSFKIDKNYFTVTQMSIDEFELKIDNKTFENLIADERSGRLKPKSIPSSSKPINKTNSDFRPKYTEEIPAYLQVNSNQRNDDAFYDSDDNDFDFSGGKSNSNTFAFKEPDNQMQSKKNQGNQLLDLNDIAEIKMVQQNQGTVNNQSSSNQNQGAFQHNQNIFNTINIFGEEKPTNDNLMMENIFSPSPNPMNQSNQIPMPIPTSMPMNSNQNQMNFTMNNNNPSNNTNNNMNQMNYNINTNYGSGMSFDIGKNQMGMNMNSNIGEPFNHNLNQGNLGMNSNPNNNMQMGYGDIMSNTNLSQPIQMKNQPMSNDNYNNFNYSPIQPKQQSQSIDFSNPHKKESSPFNLNQDNQSNSMNPSPQVYQPFQNQDVLQPPQQHQQQQQQGETKNDFKSKLMMSGLVDIDNLLSNKTTQKTNSNSNYNFSIQPSNSFGGNNNAYGNNLSNNNMNSNLNSNMNMNYASPQKDSNLNATPFDF